MTPLHNPAKDIDRYATLLTEEFLKLRRLQDQSIRKTAELCKRIEEEQQAGRMTDRSTL